MKTAYIMRGIPGSGKSTLAKTLVNGNGAIHSTDTYFYQGEDYVFDPALLKENHDRNFRAFCKSLNNDVLIVICDNTNVRRCHFEQYEKAAREAGYRVAYVTLPHPEVEIAASRTIHNVPAHAIRRMIKDWEH